MNGVKQLSSGERRSNFTKTASKFGSCSSGKTAKNGCCVLCGCIWTERMRTLVKLKGLRPPGMGRLSSFVLIGLPSKLRESVLIEFGEEPAR